MRAALFAAPFLVALAPASGFTQSAPYAATVTDPEVKLRAGGSDKFPMTGTLNRGTWVVVDHEEPSGWIAIKPPTGSVSWVPAQFVEGFDPARPMPQNVQVRCEGDVTLAAGQVGVPQPLEIRKLTVPDGTILVVIGAKVTYQNKTWYPVMPPDGDFRYLPKSAVRAGQAVSEGFTVAGASSAKPNPPAVPAASPALSIPGEASRPATLPEAAPGTWSRSGAVNHPLWAQAEQAEQAGRLDDAERLFFELARKMNEPNGDHDIANQCYTRIHGLREKKRLNQASGSSMNTPAVPFRSEERAGSRVAGTAGSANTAAAATTAAERGSLPPPSNDPRDNEPATAGKWSGPGFLIRTGYTLDGKTTFALESSPRVVRYYAVEGGNVDLKKYLNRRVDLYGIVTTRRDVAQPYIVVTAVELAP